MLRNLSWALLMLKARSLLERISRLCNFFTLFTNTSPRGLFLATTLRPEHGLGLADILLPSINIPHHYRRRRQHQQQHSRNSSSTQQGEHDSPTRVASNHRFRCQNGAFLKRPRNGCCPAPTKLGKKGGQRGEISGIGVAGSLDCERRGLRWEMEMLGLGIFNGATTFGEQTGVTTARIDESSSS